MADVQVNQDSGGGTTWLLVVVALVLVALVAWFLFAGGGREETATEVNVDVPEAEAPKIDVPENVEVNVQGSAEK